VTVALSLQKIRKGHSYQFTAQAQPDRLNGLCLSALCLFVVTLFHLTRNLTSAYFALCAAAFVVFIVFWIRSRSSNVKINLFVILILSLFTYCVLISFYFVNNFGSPLIGISRYGFIVPVIISLAYGVNRSSFSAFFLLWAAFAILAAISLPIQFVIGPVSWFSDSFERVGTTRFGSLAGSLTTFGNIVGAALFIVLMAYRRPFYIVVAVALLLLGALASLQKAAFASLAISIITMILARRVKTSTILGLFVVLGAIGVIVTHFADYQTRNTIFLLFETFAGTVDASQASDVSIIQSAYDRIFELPVAAFDYYGPHALWSGVGVFGGSGSLGYPFLPHTHNLIAETIMLYGLISGTLMSLYVMMMLLRSFVILINIGDRYDQNSVIAAGILINITLPAMFAGALFYHPAGATIFWAAFIYLQFHARPSAVG
jgi:hypothetical protein